MSKSWQPEVKTTLQPTETISGCVWKTVTSCMKSKPHFLALPVLIYIRTKPSQHSQPVPTLSADRQTLPPSSQQREQVGDPTWSSAPKHSSLRRQQCHPPGASLQFFLE